MSALCETCSKLKPLPNCVERIVIGIIAGITVPVVYIRDITTGLVTRYLGAVDGGGNVYIDCSEAFSEEHAYELWCIESGTNIDDKKLITVSNPADPAGLNDYCLSLHFELIKDADTGDPESYTTQTLEAA